MSDKSKAIWHYAYTAMMLANAIVAIYCDHVFLAMESSFAAGAFLIMSFVYHADYVSNRKRVAP